MDYISSGKFNCAYLLTYVDMCPGEGDGAAEVGGGNDVIADASFVQSTMSVLESTNDAGILSVGGASLFSMPLAQSVKPA